MNCPVCGKSVRPTDEFCDNCGAVLAPTLAAAAGARVGQATGGATASKSGTGAPRKCPNCGIANAATEDYCINCGADLTSVPPPAVPVAASVQSQPASAPIPSGIPSVPSTTGVMGTVQCPQCGNLIAHGDKFCRKCGFKTTDLSHAGVTASTSGSTGSSSGGLKIGVGSKLGQDGRYQIEKSLGAGGMGAVFLAEDTLLKRKVVIKALLQSDDPDLVEASIKEREFLAAVKHPNVVQIYDFLQIGTDGYIVMEFVKGKTLFSIMEDRQQAFAPGEAIRYTLGILPAFAYLHRLGLVYCDFKPQNVMLEEHKDGTTGVKLIDLGTVIRYEPNPPAVYGTQGFYAKEAVKNPSPMTDLYTVGRSLAYMVSLMDLDNPPFGMPPSEAYAVFRNNPVLYRLLYKATDPNPARRFKTADEFGSQLEGVLRVIEGGQTGQPVSSKLFDSAALHTGKLGLREISALDSKDKAFELLQQGDAALKAGLYTQALAAYNQAVGVNSNSVDAHLRLAELYMEKDQFTQALAEITRVQKIDPSNWKIAWYTGRLLEAQGNLPAALDQYRQLVEDLPGELPPLMSLARVQARLGNYQDAVNTYQLVMRANPDSNEALFGAAEAYRNMGKFDDSAQVLGKVSQTSARFIEAQQAISELYLYQKKKLDPDDLKAVAQALRNLTQRGVESPQFLQARADFYREAWKMSAENKIPTDLKLPYHDDDVQNPATPPRRQLGALAEESYAEYLKRLPADAVNREEIVRQKFKVAPWRLF